MSSRPGRFVAVGVLMLAAACGRDQKAADRVLVTEPSLAKGASSAIRTVTVAPSSASLAIGATVQLTATARDNKGNVIATTFTWTSSNAAVATVTATGLVTGISAGSVSIRATTGSKSGSSAVTVTGGPAPTGEVMIAAGDIAQCGSSNDEATASVVNGIAGTVAVLGDNAYENGSASDYANCYDPSWGAFKARTRPSVGNHEYQTTGASGYYNYFGAAAGDPAKGYYSYDLGAWHIVVLNSNCSFVSCAAGSAQEQWLRADLAANTKACTLAYWHHPRFNSGSTHGNNTAVAPFWDALYQFGAEIILNGHEHVYERFAPQTPQATADPTAGIREFVVGTGGRSFYAFGTPKANSDVRNNDTYGVLQLTLGAGSYAWQFRRAAGGTFSDSGTGVCH